MKTRARRDIFCTTFLFKSLFCRNYCDQSKINFETLKDFYVINMAKCRNISHFSNNDYGLGNIKQYWKELFVENSC